jgi:hypothetical protein
MVVSGSIPSRQKPQPSLRDFAPAAEHKRDRGAGQTPGAVHSLSSTE